MTLQVPRFLAKQGQSGLLLTLFGTWTLLVAGILAVVFLFSIREDREVALSRAIDSYHKDLSARRWASERGGVYVPLDELTPPNPHLAHLPERDITTPSGRQLTLVNPAYMTRMIHEVGADEFGLKGHITSLNPIRAENAPDPWERKALEAFERGARHYSEVLIEQGQPILRFMGVFLVETSCLSCHAHQNYRSGDVRGGISVTVPVGSGTTPIGLTHRGISLLAVIAFWMMGGAGILISVRKLARSVAKQNQVLAEVEDSTRRFRQLFESSPAPMLIHQGGRFIQANAAAARLLEAETPEQLLGREVLDIIQPEFRAAVAQRMQAAYRDCLPTPPVEEVFLTLQGNAVGVELLTVPLELRGGPAILVFPSDLTEHRRAEADRIKLETELQHAHKLDSLGSLAGGIAHDMNNVLAAVLGMASLLLTNHEDDAPLVKSLKIIETAAGRGRDLVKGLTDFARKDLQEAQLLDLNALLQGELELLKRTSRQRFVFAVQLERTLPLIMGEPSTLGSAFMNLCVNAFDAMPQGGTLHVQTRFEGDQVKLTVTDTGQGIPAELLPRVTEPFFTTKPPGRGTGLGLAMVYGTVKAHRGTLAIQSEVGKGTCITLCFPAAITAASEATLLAPLDSPPGLPLRILLVDDDELLLSVLPPMLQQLEHQVETASSGLEAIRRLQAGLAADLVILDHHMPGLSGAETLPRLLQLRPSLHILVITGFLDAELSALLADFPLVVTLKKPFTLEELLRALKGFQSCQP